MTRPNNTEIKKEGKAIIHSYLGVVVVKKTDLYYTTSELDDRITENKNVINVIQNFIPIRFPEHSKNHQRINRQIRKNSIMKGGFESILKDREEQIQIAEIPKERSATKIQRHISFLKKWSLMIQNSVQ